MRLPKILIDMHYLRNEFKGFGQYCLHLARNIDQLNPERLDISFFLPLKNMGKFDNISSRLILPFERNLGVYAKTDLYHATTDRSVYLPRNEETPVIFTIHDAIFATLDKDNEHTRREYARLQKVIDRSAGLIFISQYSRDLVVQKFDVPAEVPCRVIYNGNPFGLLNVKNQVHSSRDSGYLFTLGELRLYKNIKSLIRMLPYLPESITFIHAGKYKETKKEPLDELSKSLGVSHRVKFLGIVDEKRKIELYKNSLAYVHPSLAEGFGLPVVEAMSIGLPVICSNRTSLPEVAGSAGYYWENFNPEYMAGVVKDCLQAYDEDPENYRARLQQQARKFSWQNAAKQYLDFYQQILKTHN